jgi:ubiquinone/menaquinone biosynthesis C-methylase UbiE
VTKDDITKKNEAFWDSMAGRYDRYFWFTRWTQRKLVASLDLDVNPRVLDLACGTGWAVIYAHDRARGRGEFHGLDISQAMIRQSQRNSGARKGLQFHRANAEDSR